MIYIIYIYIYCILLVWEALLTALKYRKKYSVFIYITKRNHTLCTLYINRRVHCVFYSKCQYIRNLLAYITTTYLYTILIVRVYYDTE